MSFLLFLLVNLVLFVRPAEIVPSLIGLPIYNVLISTCLVAAAAPVLGQLKGEALARQPITCCVLGLLGAVVLSHVANFDFGSAQEKGVDFGKVVLYYLLLIAVVDTPKRLKTFLAVLVLLTVVLAGLAVLQYHGKINLPALEALERVEFNEETGERDSLLQLRSTGIYNDPNDLCLILVVAIMVSLYQLSDRGAGLFRVAWAAPVVLFLYAVILTSSRGGFLALLAALATLFVARFGWRRSVPLMVLAVPALLLLTGGRQTRISTGEDTAQERMKYWSEGLHLIAHSPKWGLTGIGVGHYADEVGQVAHNSFVHAFVEMGFFGGALFLGAFYLAARSLHRLGAVADVAVTQEVRGLRPFLLATVVGYSAGMFSLSRCYIVPTYLVLGLVASYYRVGVVAPAGALPRADGRLAARVAAVGVAFLVFIYLFIRVAVR